MAALYELLGVQPSASTDEIRNAYRDLAMQHHPDRGGDPFVWSNIQRAYDTLSDLQKRATYDRTKEDAGGGAEKQFARGFGEGTWDMTDSEAQGSQARKGGISIVKQARSPGRLWL